MSHRRYPPAYFRYLKARLWNLARPGFWGTAIFLSVVGLVIKEYWARPDFLTQRNNSQIANDTSQPANSSLTPEDKAIAADIDNLPLLVQESGSDNLPLGGSNSNQNDRVKKETSLLEELINTNETEKNDTQSKSDDANPPSTTQKLENPFLTQADKLLQLNSQSSSQFPGNNTSTQGFSQQGVAQTSLNFGAELGSGVNSAQNTLSQSPLQTALDRAVSPNQSIFTGTASTPTNSVATSGTSPNNISNQTMTPTSKEIGGGLSTPLFTGTGSLQPRAADLLPQTSISASGHTQPGQINQLPQNSISTPGYTQPGQTNLLPSQYPIFSTEVQSGQVNSQPQTPIAGTNYVQPGQSNLLQNSVSNTQPGQINQLPQNSTPTTGYTQPAQVQTNPWQSTNPNSDRRFGFETFLNRGKNTNNSVSNTPAWPNVSQPAPVEAPNTVMTPTNPSSYYPPIPNPGAVNYTAPVVPNNYGNKNSQF
jgi:hypothetical protein